MKAELLPYKYKSLKFFDQYDERAITQLGWKARKYIKWSDVHIDDDREILKIFGDLAIDEKIINKELFPRINQILLNVQYWRLDKEKWSIEPEHEAAWDRTGDLIIAGNDNPDIILSYLSDYYGGLDSISSEMILTSFLNLILAELIVSVRKFHGAKFQEELVSGSFATVLDYLVSNEHDLKELDIHEGRDIDG